jgi:hypothetical protein
MREYTAVLAGCRAWLGLERGRPAEVRRQSDTALETWREHAPGYPLKWIALFPRLALEQEEGDPFLLATLVGQLLAPGNARFPDALAQSLQDAARALDEQDADFARQAVAEAVGFARTHAYL